jgi:pimeloyl-ACP methyl ester carboxylesterase
MNIKQFAWTGMVPVDDIALYVTETGGRGRPVVYLNGAYADQSHWRRVITGRVAAKRATRGAMLSADM